MTLDSAFHNIQPRPYSSATSIWLEPGRWRVKSWSQGRTTTFLDKRSIPSDGVGHHRAGMVVGCFEFIPARRVVGRVHHRRSDIDHLRHLLPVLADPSVIGGSGGEAEHIRADGTTHWMQQGQLPPRGIQ